VIKNFHSFIMIIFDIHIVCMGIERERWIVSQNYVTKVGTELGWLTLSS
jgi:hypothetical protein